MSPTAFSVPPGVGTPSPCFMFRLIDAPHTGYGLAALNGGILAVTSFTAVEDGVKLVLLLATLAVTLFTLRRQVRRWLHDRAVDQAGGQPAKCPATIPDNCPFKTDPERCPLFTEKD